LLEGTPKLMAKMGFLEKIDENVPTLALISSAPNKERERFSHSQGQIISQMPPKNLY
jgi:hypothetical protein